LNGNTKTQQKKMATVSGTSSSKSQTKRKHDGERKNIYLGMNDFDKIVKENAAFIDKTMFIKEWMEARVEVSVFLRPRRFGKSTNLSMLKSFFSFGAELKDFSGYFIGKETEFIEKHRGKYPVVSLNMKGIGGDDWGEMLREIWSCLRDTLEDQEENLNKQDVKFIGIDCHDATAQPNETIAAGFLNHLMKHLEKKYKQNVIVLIDDYDAPLNHAFRMGYYAKASSFFEEFYSNGLKVNSALKRACLMGIVEIRGCGNQSGLNNFVTYPCNEQEFSQYFGFTKEEITTFLDNNKEEIQGVMEWYNGYCIGSCQVVNPWSFMSFMKSRILKSYWTRTASIDSICATINPVLSVKLIKIMAQLYEANGHENGYEIAELSTNFNYGCSFDLKVTLCILVHAGYPAYNKKKVFMPNQEIKNEWANCSIGVTDSGIVGAPCQQDIMNDL
jgi:Predicted AAA-ATPase